MSEQGHYDRPGAGDDAPQRSVRSGLATVAGRGFQLVLQLGLAMVLARLLTPEDFGVQAMVLPIALLVNSIANGGVQSAIIQRDELDHAEASALFWEALKWNVVLCAAMALLAPILARVYDEPRLTGIGVTWAAVILASTLSAVPEALIKRQFRFGVVVRAQLIALVVSIVAAVAAAWLGFRHWSFIIQVAVLELGRVTIIWTQAGWRPAPRSADPVAHREASHALRRYWQGFAGARALTWVGDHSDRITVGAVGGAPMLGLYDGAKRWGTFAFLELYLSLSEVAVASLSRVRHDRQQFTRYVRGAFLPVLLISLPIAAFMFVEARGVLRFLLGPQWVDADTMLRALCVSSAVVSIGRLAQWIQLANGATRRQVQWACVTTPLLLVGVIIGSRYGALGVGVGFAIANALTSVPGLAWAVRGTTLPFFPILATWLLPLAASVIAGSMLFFAGPNLPDAQRLFGLVVRGSLFVLAYATVLVVMPGGLTMIRTLRRTGAGSIRRPVEGAA